MQQRIYRYIFAFLFCIIGFAIDSSAQFKEEAFKQSYASPSDSTGKIDTAAKLFSLKDWAGGMSRKHTIKVGTMFIGSAIMPGTAQYYNKDYWKMPIFYAGMGAFGVSGGYYMNKYNQTKKAYDRFQAEKDAFVKIDLRAISEINTNASKAKVMSIHPKGTYAFVENDGEMILNITNPDKFWQQTKYLVIQVM